MEGVTLDVAIVGAGFGGLAMARALRTQGQQSFRVFEKHAAIGGTWRDNTYPGAACDVPSHLYSLSDAPNSGWTRLFPAQAEIRDYLETLAAPLHAEGRIQTGFQLVRAQWNTDAAAWSLTSAAGERAHARRLVLALGGLHQPAWPELPGREAFGGASFHTARWDHAFDLRGKRVAVIGAGASAAQVVPAIVQRCAQLHVVQRTPPWVLPRPDRALPIALQRAFARVPALRLALRGAIFAWLEAVAFGLFAPRSAFWARALARRHLRREVPDAALRARLTPHYPIGCKRVLISSDWYRALQVENCSLIDTGIERIESEGLRLMDGRRIPVDVIVYATGFRPMDVLNELEILGRDGRRLADDWRDRPIAHLGIGVHGYPNLGFVLGPNTALGHNSVLYMIESQVRHLLALQGECARRGARAAEPTASAQAGFIAQIDRRFAGTAWASGCSSWYLDAQGRNIALWIGSALAYRRRTCSVRSGDYEFN